MNDCVACPDSCSPTPARFQPITSQPSVFFMFAIAFLVLFASTTLCSPPGIPPIALFGAPGGGPWAGPGCALGGGFWVRRRQTPPRLRRSSRPGRIRSGRTRPAWPPSASSRRALRGSVSARLGFRAMNGMDGSWWLVVFFFLFFFWGGGDPQDGGFPFGGCFWLWFLGLQNGLGFPIGFTLELAPSHRQVRGGSPRNKRFP